MSKNKKLIFGVTKTAAVPNFRIGDRVFKSRLIVSGEEIQLAEVDDLREDLEKANVLDLEKPETHEAHEAQAAIDEEKIFDALLPLVRDLLNRRLPNGTSSVDTAWVRAQFSFNRHWRPLLTFLRSGELGDLEVDGDTAIVGRSIGDPEVFEVGGREFAARLFGFDEERLLSRFGNDLEGERESAAARAAVKLAARILEARALDGEPVTEQFALDNLSASTDVPQLFAFLATGGFEEEADPKAEDDSPAEIPSLPESA